MYQGTLPPVSNRAGWTFSAEITEDDEPVDLSEATIVFSVRNKNRAEVLSATTEDDTILVPETGVFQAAFTRDQMAGLCAGTYDVGCTVAIGDDEPEQLIIATVEVKDGIVP